MAKHKPLMILLRKFLTFRGGRSDAIYYYGKYLFEPDARNKWFMVSYKKILKTFVNYEDYVPRDLATFHAGEYEINLDQTYFSITNICNSNFSRILLYLCIEGVGRTSPKEFICEYKRITSQGVRK